MALDIFLCFLYAVFKVQPGGSRHRRVPPQQHAHLRSKFSCVRVLMKYMESGFPVFPLLEVAAYAGASAIARHLRQQILMRAYPFF